MDEHTLDTICPWCGKHNEFSTNILNSGGPRPGDVSVCWTCGGLARFTENLAVARMGLEEQAEVLQSRVYQMYLKARAQAAGQ
jgi:hypothetical protein